MARQCPQFRQLIPPPATQSVTDRLSPGDSPARNHSCTSFGSSNGHLFTRNCTFPCSTLSIAFLVLVSATAYSVVCPRAEKTNTAAQLISLPYPWKVVPLHRYKHYYRASAPNNEDASNNCRSSGAFCRQKYTSRAAKNYTTIPALRRTLHLNPCQRRRHSSRIAFAVIIFS